MNRDFVTQTKYTHFKSKANPDAVDETVTSEKPSGVTFNAGQVIDFAMDVMAEKEKLATAISEAKKRMDFDIDRAASINKSKQNLILNLSSMSRIKSSKNISRGTAFKFNAEGNQVSYYYDVESSVSIDFDRNDVRKLVKKLQKECDEASYAIDRAQVEVIVDFEPRFEDGDTLEDILSAE